MKNKLFIKIGTIFLLLSAVVLFMDSTQDNNYYQASAASSKVQLYITPGSITCTGWYGILNIGAVNASFGANTVSGTYTTNSWKCTDTKGSQIWTFSIRITGDLIGPSTYTISSGAAAICLTAAPSKTQGGTVSAPPTTTIPTCNSTGSLVATQELLKRSDTNGQIYEYSFTPRIIVYVPASQAPGMYTGTLEIAVP